MKKREIMQQYIQEMPSENTEPQKPDRLRMNGDADRDEEPELGSEDQKPKLSVNSYANKKSAAQSMLDVALLMANASQLKLVLEEGPDFNFYVPLIFFISISLILQLIVGILLIFIVRWNLEDKQCHDKLDALEDVATAFVFGIVVVNVFITAFGVQRPNPHS